MALKYFYFNEVKFFVIFWLIFRYIVDKFRAESMRRKKLYLEVLELEDGKEIFSRGEYGIYIYMIE